MFKVFSALKKDSIGGAGVHVDTALGNGGQQKKKPKPSDKVETVDCTKQDFSIGVEFTKAVDEQRVVYGWASMSTNGDSHLSDLQGDKIAVADLVKAAHEFITHSRTGGDLHEVMGVGRVVESLVFTPEVQKALGIDLGKVGWMIGMHVTDEGVWKRVKDGELKAFSIGGSATRVPE